MRASTRLAQNPPPGMSPRLHFAWVLWVYLQEEGQIPMTDRFDITSEDEIQLPESAGIVWTGTLWEYKNSGQKHGSEEQGSDSQPQYEPEAQYKLKAEQHGQAGHNHATRTSL